MANRERDALDALENAISRLENHRGFVRQRSPGLDASKVLNAEAHEACSLALARAREARFWCELLCAREEELDARGRA